MNKLFNYPIALLLFFLLSFQTQAQVNFNLDSISNLDYDEIVSDIWGYTSADGTEYAVMGLYDGTAIISLEDPANPREVFFVEGALSIWRDIKTWDNYLYVVADRGDDGLLIINMEHAPDSIEIKFWKPILEDRLRSCHNLFIDDLGYAYLSACDLNWSGVLIIDLFTDPWNPEFVGAAKPTYSHDNYVAGNMLYSAEIFDGVFSIQDISDRSNPILLNTQQTTSLFTHHCWLSDDGNYLFTADEMPNAYIDAYDVSDPLDIQYLSSFRTKTNEGAGVVPHNVYYHNGFLIISYYTDGIVILDVHKPDNMVKVGQYDTFLGEHGDFFGAWGAYPFLPSGLLIASDRQKGLYVLEPNYVRASYLEGKVISAHDQSPINNVSVEIAAEVPNSGLTSPGGNYQTGTAFEGIHSVTFSHPDYIDTTLEANLIRGQVVVLNVELRKDSTAVSTGDLSAHPPVWSISPNPAVEDIYFNMAGNTDFFTLQLVIYDLAGKPLITERVTESNRSVDISSLVSGIYIIRVLNEDGVQLGMEKLVVSK